MDHLRDPHPALLTIRGNVLVVHDRSLAQEMVTSLTHVLASNAQIAMASTHGQGWRSKLVQKQQQKVAMDHTPPGAEHGQPSLHIASVVPHSSAASAASNFDVEQEVRACMVAIEAEARAQVVAQVNNGCAHHDGRQLVGDAAHGLCNAAKHNFKNSAPFAETPLREHRRQCRGRFSPDSEHLVAQDLPPVSEPVSTQPNAQQRVLSLQRSEVQPRPEGDWRSLPAHAWGAIYQKFIADHSADGMGTVSNGGTITSSSRKVTFHNEAIPSARVTEHLRSIDSVLSVTWCGMKAQVETFASGSVVNDIEAQLKALAPPGSQHKIHKVDNLHFL